MTSIVNKKLFVVIGISVLFLGAFIAVANAEHAWSKYHWDISTVDSPLKFGNNVSDKWTESLDSASDDWGNEKSVLKNAVIPGAGIACDPVSGQVEVCNGEYGINGWLGIAQIWVYRGKDGHIAQGLVKLNDTYFDSTEYDYDTPAWRDYVMCQEIGHTLGLGHVDEDTENVSQGTCMDYTASPTGVDLHPNDHDYAMLTEIYGHLNGVEKTKGGGGGNGKGGGKGKPNGVGNGADLNDPSAWGNVVRKDVQGNNSLYVRNLGNGVEVFTFVTWAN